MKARMLKKIVNKLNDDQDVVIQDGNTDNVIEILGVKQRYVVEGGLIYNAKTELVEDGFDVPCTKTVVIEMEV